MLRRLAIWAKKWRIKHRQKMMAELRQSPHAKHMGWDRMPAHQLEKAVWGGVLQDDGEP